MEMVFNVIIQGSINKEHIMHIRSDVRILVGCQDPLKGSPPRKETIYNQTL